MIDVTKLKLGKGAPKFDGQRLRLRDYLTPALPAPPVRIDWTNGITNWPMLLNGPNSFGKNIPPEGLGNCTIASKLHTIQIWMLNNPGCPKKYTPADAAALKYYEQFDGYVPGDSNTDNGGIIVDVLNDWRKLPAGMDGHVLLGYADPQPQNMGHVEQSIAFFGAVDIGLQLPVSAQGQISSGQPWEKVSDDGGVWGGHDVTVPRYQSDTRYLTCITWNQVQLMSYDFWDAYCDESHTLWGHAWSPVTDGIKIKDFAADIALVTG